MSRTITVSNAQELTEALRAAQGGETVLLEAGDYGRLDMGRTRIPGRYDSEVVIRSADPEDMASFGGLRLQGVANVTFEAILFDYVYDGAPVKSARPFRGSDTENVTIRDSVFAGDVASGTGTAADGYGTAFGLSIGGAGTVIENNEFHTWYKALAVSGRDVVVAGNEIHSIRADGINAVKVQGIRIEDNHIHDFVAAPDSGDHRDMIQFWTSGAEAPSTDIVIRGNVLDIGAGRHTQTLFMRNEEVDRGRAGEEMFYRDVLIEDNVITNAHHHGISVGETAGLTIRGNTVLQRLGENDDLDAGARVLVPKINVAGASRDVVIEGNVAGGVAPPREDWTVRDNLIVQTVDPDDPGYAGDVFVDSSLASGVPIARPGVADGLGAPATFEGAAAASFSVHDDAASSAARVFDATSATGGEPRPDATYLWRFSDGAEATGPVVRREFDGPGTYGATLEVTGPDGTVARADLETRVDGGRALEMAGGEIRVLHGEADAGPEAADGAVIDLGAPGVAAHVPAAALQRIYGAEALDMRMTLSEDAPAAEGVVLHLYGALRLTVTGESRLRVEAWTDEGHVRLETEAGLFRRGAEREIRIVHEAEAGRIGVEVDGAEHAGAPLEGGLGNGTKEGLAFGDAWGRQNFDGTLGAFSIDVVDPVRSPYEGPIAPVEAAQAAPAAPAAILEAALPEAAAPMPVFDLAEAGVAQVALQGGVEDVEDDGEGALVFDGARAFASLGMLDVHRDGALTAELTFDEAQTGGGAERLLWNHLVFGLETEGDLISVRVGTDAGFERFETEVEGLGDGTQKAVRVAVDSALDRIQIVVDGEVVLDDAASSDIDLTAADTGRDWMIGTPWNRWFEGEIGDVRLYDEARFEEAEQKEDDVGLLG